MAKPGHGLRHLLPAAAMTEGAVRAVAADRSINDARPQGGDVFLPKAELFHRARAIALREHIRSPYQRLQARRLLLLRQIEEAAALAMVRIQHMLGDLWQLRGGHHQYVGSVLGESSCRHRPRQDAGEVQGADTAQGTVAAR